jgi:hypothetical protein
MTLGGLRRVKSTLFVLREIFLEGSLVRTKSDAWGSFCDSRNNCPVDYGLNMYESRHARSCDRADSPRPKDGDRHMD